MDKLISDVFHLSTESRKILGKTLDAMIDRYALLDPNLDDPQFFDISSQLFELCEKCKDCGIKACSRTAMAGSEGNNRREQYMVLEKAAREKLVKILEKCVLSGRNNATDKCANALKMSAIALYPKAQEGMDLTPLTGQVASFLNNLGTIVSEFGENAHENVNLIRDVLSQESLSKESFVDFLKENENVRKMIANLIALSSTSVNYMDLLQLLFNYPLQEPFLDFLSSALEKAKQGLTQGS